MTFDQYYNSLMDSINSLVQYTRDVSRKEMSLEQKLRAKNAVKCTEAFRNALRLNKFNLEDSFNKAIAPMNKAE